MVTILTVWKLFAVELEELPCNATAKLCKTRNNFVFWDMFHPTQAAFQLTAVILHDGEARFVAPVNFRKLTEDC
ncbi:unnamed protein product [Thlaspi arvense]|uniref:GDSL esterase/lipase n=1 Tax=Thlaspi arvense TaxID=13288 RepID=A0AAU9RSG4_THLAR|nr:unnamed protein product [Thlaspi arvense]